MVRFGFPHPETPRASVLDQKSVDTNTVMTYLFFMGDASDPSAERETYRNLVRTHERLNRDLGRFFQDRGITAQQYRVLEVLHADGGGLSCQEVGQRMLNHVPDVTRLLDRLEKASLVSRARCQNDRRVVRSHLTDVGRELVEATAGPLAEAQRALLGGLSDDEVQTLRDLLHKASSGSGD